MGSTAHPNSAPAHVVTLGRYRIGRHPVTNGAYRVFVEATGRRWRSQDGAHPGRSNAPAVDLTWHDARAYCAWLTTRWRAEGRIAADEAVRLPTEPDSCTVGLFPAGRSPDGCHDMAGQVWEWTTTLWGEDMATPRFAYPYADDGREDPDAAADVRRVLRGACFLSPREKANCIYRGSLEPDGYWRGNGFRIVVAPV
jgi:iron(II)-dependent oxidoreductase